MESPLRTLVIARSPAEGSRLTYPLLRAGLKVGTVGDAVIHHFGSITQKAMKQEQGVDAFGDHRYLYAKLGLGWWGRQRAKFARKAQTARWMREERAAHGLTLHMVHQAGQVEYR